MILVDIAGCHEFCHALDVKNLYFRRILRYQTECASAFAVHSFPCAWFQCRIGIELFAEFVVKIIGEGLCYKYNLYVYDGDTQTYM